MATGVDELLDMLFDMIDEAKNAPLSGGKCIIERNKALDIIDDVKAQLPVELAEARKILNARAEFVAAAKREAEEIKKRAADQADQMASDTEVAKLARQKATEMLKQAETQAWEVKDRANNYCDNLLQRTEEALNDAHAEMRKVHGDFRAAMDSLTPPAQVQAQSSGRKMYDAEADE